jgi:hypothetical protein
MSAASAAPVPIASHFSHSVDDPPIRCASPSRQRGDLYLHEGSFSIELLERVRAPRECHIREPHDANPR